ncbi:unnamed protein product [Dovyalis caffra]|uniref:NAD-dependent epimerase/dehydratase domain-containing protein n=1 Tax=Dovyalis caffra TaxID=77055 RepID=A0AAV1S3H5_9ROSI|nr:unnamed protein product [Dovyalis caffra]
MEPAVFGTQNVLNACLKAKVKRVVVVSTCGAVLCNPTWPKDRAMNEDCWSDKEFCKSIGNYYCLAKTTAETEALEYARITELDMVTVCPSIVIGPMLQSTLNANGHESLEDRDRPFVDVRDLAEALLLAYEKPEAKGRYICTSYSIRTHALVDNLKSICPNYNYPKGFIEVEEDIKLSSRKLQNLGWKYRSIEETIADTVRNYQESGLLSAGGFLASWLVKFLLSEGYTVHGTVRDPSDDKNAHLMKLENATENLKLFKADLLDYEGLYVAITGCSGVFHVACPLPSDPASNINPKQELLEAAVTGTRNVLNACSQTKVKKVIAVSSIAAVMLNPNWPKDQVMNEESWSDLEFCEANKQWYFLAKTIAEKEALEYAKRNELNVVTLCPSIIIGPLLQSTMNSSGLYLLSFLKGGWETADSGTRAFVDVRDTAEALLLTYEKHEAEGRYICSSHDITTQDLVEKLKAMYPHYNYPKSFAGGMPSMELSSEKLLNLGWKYRSLEETLVDAIKNYEERGSLIKND